MVLNNIPAPFFLVRVVKLSLIIEANVLYVQHK